MANPRNVGRIDHIVIVIRPENLDGAAQEFAGLLDIELEGPYQPADLGTRQYINWDSGIMLVAPVDLASDTEHTRFLAEHGEGLYRIVFGVADQEAALERASSLGFPTAWKYDGLTVTDNWRKKFETIKDGIITPPIHGVRINFGQLEPVVAVGNGGRHDAVIDHVVILIRPENLDGAAHDFSRLLDIELQGPYEPEGLGVRDYVDWDSGITLVAPLDTSQPTEQNEFLAQHGEGLFRLVFRVADQQQALHRAEMRGYQTAWTYDALAGNPDFAARFKRIDEAILDRPIHGVRLNLSLIETV